MELIQVLNLKYTLKCKQAQRKSHKQGKARTPMMSNPFPQSPVIDYC
ncbi:hypothetical protein T12_6898 [Trichinella patagoniensis]|uniref:Uncharacterized protein n=1 Tax=Trichinella patagoniensis TaxID=990121 RepID=A0A0V0XCU0_9BILA|nr:hypothetical protein T12_6898 [Trichinella patagoniensis]